MLLELEYHSSCYFNAQISAEVSGIALEILHTEDDLLEANARKLKAHCLEDLWVASTSGTIRPKGLLRSVLIEAALMLRTVHPGARGSELSNQSSNAPCPEHQYQPGASLLKGLYTKDHSKNDGQCHKV